MTHIYVTFDGDSHWLECFAADPDADDGQIVAPVGSGDKWDVLAARVSAHCTEHGCGGAADSAETPAFTPAGTEHLGAPESTS